MKFGKRQQFSLWRASALVVLLALSAMLAMAGEHQRSVLVMTSTNDPSGNNLVVFKLNTYGTPSLTMVNKLPTGGNGGAGGNAGILQFQNNLGAVANFGSNTVTQLIRYNEFVAVGRTIHLAGDCVKPDSVALADNRLFVVGANCAETHAWPLGNAVGNVVKLADPSSAQIAVGEDWAAVTQTSGSVLQLPLTKWGLLTGTSTPLTLPSNANDTPLGAAFWGNLLGFTPAHSPDSFAVVNAERDVFPIVGPTPPYPSNAPCWVAKGAGSVWYTGNSPGQAISVFFTDAKGGVFYKSVSVPGVPTDLTVSADGNWLAAIYTAGGQGYIAVFSIDNFGGLTLAATSNSIGVTSFNGVAISE